MLPSCAKLFCSEMVGRVADRAVQVHGGAGYIRDVPVERFYRDARLFRIYEGTTQIQQIIIGRALLARASNAQTSADNVHALQLTPGEDRLLEVAHPRRATVQRHLAELVQHRRRRRVDQVTEDRQLDHRLVRLRDRHEPRVDVRAEPTSRRARCDLVGVRRQLPHVAAHSTTGVMT